jgi:hypothetical protein
MVISRFGCRPVGRDTQPEEEHAAPAAGAGGAPP